MLHIIDGKGQRRLRRFQGAVNGAEQCQSPIRKRRSSSDKQTKSLEQNSSKRARVDDRKKQMGEQTPFESPNTLDQIMEGQDVSTLGVDDHELPTYQEDNNLDTVDEAGPDGDKECHSLISQYALSKMKQTRRSRFGWTEELDR